MCRQMPPQIPARSGQGKPTYIRSPPGLVAHTRLLHANDPAPQLQCHLGHLAGYRLAGSPISALSSASLKLYSLCALFSLSVSLSVCQSVCTCMHARLRSPSPARAAESPLPRSQPGVERLLFNDGWCDNLCSPSHVQVGNATFETIVRRKLTNWQKQC